MRILIVGLGSIGRRHLRNIKGIDANIEVAALREHTKSSDLDDDTDLVSEFFFDETESLNWNADIVVIANPAPFHMQKALFFAKAGKHLFIEKPVSSTLEGVDAVIQECKARNLVLMVGYVLRFLEPLKVVKKMLDAGKIGRILSIRAEVGRFLPDWRPGSDYRKNVSARSDLGGGVIFELSHELDYVRWLVGEVVEVSACVDTISDLEIDVEDVAEINLRFANKAIGNVHLDMFDHGGRRSCRIVGTEGTIEVKFDHDHYVRLFNKGNSEPVKIYDNNNVNAYNQMFTHQMQHFFDCVENKKQPDITGHDGKRVVEIALSAKCSAKEGRVVKF